MLKQFLLGAVLIIAPTLARGEQVQDKPSDRKTKTAVTEIFGDLQYAHFESGSINLGSGQGFDAGIRIFPRNSRFGIGFRVGRFQHEVQYDRPKPIEGVNARSVDGSAVTAFGEIYVRSRAGKVQPYAFGGLGLISAEHAYRSDQGDRVINARTAGLSLGVGFKVNVTKRLSVIPELRLLTSSMFRGGHGYTAYSAGIGCSYSF